jgi:REP element-mobilizing transposase RayT
MAEQNGLRPFVVSITVRGVDTNEKGRTKAIENTICYRVPNSFLGEHHLPQLERMIRDASEEGIVNRHLRNIELCDDVIHGMITCGQDDFKVTEIEFEPTTKEVFGKYESVLRIITEFYSSDYLAIEIKLTQGSKKFVAHHPFRRYSKHQIGTDKKKDQKRQVLTGHERDELIEQYKKIYLDQNCEIISVSFPDIFQVLSTDLGRKTFYYWTPDIPAIKPHPTAHDLEITKLKKEVAELKDEMATMKTLVLEMQKMISAQQT